MSLLCNWNLHNTRAEYDQLHMSCFVPSACANIRHRRIGCPSSSPYLWNRRRKTKLAVKWYQVVSVMSSWLWAHDGRGIVWRLREERRNLKHVERHIALTWEVMIWDDVPAAGHCQSSFLAELERRQLHWIIFRLNRIVRALTWLRCCKLCLSRWKL
jgi:hypothetical protein